MAVAAARGLGFTYPLDGYGRLFQSGAPGLSGIAAAAVGAWADAAHCGDALRRASGAVVAADGLARIERPVTTSLVSPTYSHAASMLAVGAFFAFSGRHNRSTDAGSAARAFGALAGFVTLVRWQDAVFLVVPLVDAYLELEGGPTHPARSGERAGEPRGVRRGGAGGRVRATDVRVAHALRQLARDAAGLRVDAVDTAAPGRRARIRLARPATWTPVIALSLAGLIPLSQPSTHDRGRRCRGVSGIVVTRTPP